MTAWRVKNPTTRRAAEQAQNVLIETGRVLTESVDYELTLQNVANLLVPALGEWCVVDLVEDGHLIPSAVMHADPAKVDVIRELRRRYPAVVSDRIGAPNVVRTGRPELYERLTGDHLQQIAQDDRHLKILRDLRLRSGIAVPLVARGKRLGAMTLVSEQPGYYSDSDLPLIQELGHRCGLAVDNARAHRDLRASEQRFRLLVEQVQDYAIYMMDPQGRISSWNVGAERVKGYTADEILGQHVSIFYTPADIEAGVPQRVLETAKKEGRFQGEGWRVRKGGTRFWADVTLTALRDEAGRLRGFSKITRDMTARHEAERALRASEERLRLVIDSVREYAIFTMDIDGRVDSWNSGAQRVLGYEEHEILGHSADVIFTPEDRQAGVPSKEMQKAIETGQAADDRWQIRSDGTRFWASGTMAAMRDGHGRVQGFVKVLRDMTEIKEAEERLQHLNETLEQRVAKRTAEARKRAAQLQAMAVELSQVEQRERRRLAEILHDQLQQLIAAGKLHANILRDRVQEPALKQVAEKLHDLLSQSMATSRNLTVELSPPVLYDAGLVPALKWLARWMADKHKLMVTVKVEQEVELEDEDLRILAFQSVRELLFNTAKYAGVGEARVRLEPNDSMHLQIQIMDDGQGFEPGQVYEQHERRGFGLFSIRERLELLGGHISIRSAPGKGATVTLLVPLSRPDRRETAH